MSRSSTICESWFQAKKSCPPSLHKSTHLRGPGACLVFSTEALMKFSLRIAPVPCLGLLVAVQTSAQSSPVIVSTRGYINGTPLTAHTSTAFNSVGAPRWLHLCQRIPLGTDCQ